MVKAKSYRPCNIRRHASLRRFVGPKISRIRRKSRPPPSPSPPDMRRHSCAPTAPLLRPTPSPTPHARRPAALPPYACRGFETSQWGRPSARPIGGGDPARHVPARPPPLRPRCRGLRRGPPPLHGHRTERPREPARRSSYTGSYGRSCFAKCYRD